MPGPKMGPRPPDFDEHIIRQSPTFLKWLQLAPGETLRYACRDFCKGYGQDEERLMRRIMIARRNNVRDHEQLKRARKQTRAQEGDDRLRRRTVNAFSDEQVEEEMDAAAVEATRSYRTWMELPNGHEFVYNQKYIKGKELHDWLLRKNIWRRMRYRRENKKMLLRLQQEAEANGGVFSPPKPPGGELRDEQLDVDHEVTQRTAAAVAATVGADEEAVEAAVAAAETLQLRHAANNHESISAVAPHAALDAAAKLAAVTGGLEEDAKAVGELLDGDLSIAHV